MCLEELIWRDEYQMDRKRASREPLNPPPVACYTCGRPDLDAVTLPYYVLRPESELTGEMAPACAGNFLVRDRVRRIFELAIPGQCAFYPTTYLGSEETTPWWLAVPQYQVDTVQVSNREPRCRKCSTPAANRWNTLPRSIEFDSESGVHVAKSSCSHFVSFSARRGMVRRCYFSCWLHGLLQEVEANWRTAVLPGHSNEVNPVYSWEKQMASLAKVMGQSQIPTGSEHSVDETAVWLCLFLLTVGKCVSPVDLRPWTWNRASRAHRDFVSIVGAFSFNLPGDATQGYRIVSPEETGTEDSRQESRCHADFLGDDVDGVAFAFDGRGNCLCFDQGVGDMQSRIYEYRQETGKLRAYADNFAGCIRQLWHESVESPQVEPR